MDITELKRNLETVSLRLGQTQEYLWPTRPKR